jgi:hypothetical protein
MNQLFSCRLYTLLLAVGLACLPAAAAQRAAGYCEKGGVQLAIAGNLSLPTSPKIQASYPSCTATVYLSGTTTLATIYSDGNLTAKANPFSADSNGYWFFYASLGHYDVQLSGGGITTPFTVADVLVQDLSGANGAANVFFQSTATPAISRTIASKLMDTINAADFGAVCDGTTDNATAFGKLATFIASTSTLFAVHFPPGGVCMYSGGLWFTKPVLVDLDGATLNYTGTGVAIELGPRNLGYSDVAANRYYEVKNGILTGGNSMTNGIFFNPWITQPRVTSVHEYNFGNPAAYGIWFQAQNWDAVVQDSDFIVDFNATNVQRNWIYNAGTSDNGQSRLRVIRSHGTHLVAAGGVGIYTNGFNSEISSTKIEGFTPNIVVGTYASSTTISNVYLEGTRPGLKGCIQYGDLSGSQIGTYIRNLHVMNTYCNVHNTDASLTTALIAPSTTSTGLTYAIVEGNSVGAKTTGLPLVALNNSAGQIGNYAANNWMITQDGGTWGWVDSVHTLGSNITGWTGPQGETMDFTQSASDAPRFFDIKSGLTTDQFEGIRLFDRTGANKGQIYRTPTGYLTLSSGNADGIILNSNGSIQIPVGFVSNGNGTFNSLVPTATPINVNGSVGQTSDLVNINDSSGNALFHVGANGYPKVGTAVGITTTKTAGACTFTFVGGIITAVTGC